MPKIMKITSHLLKLHIKNCRLFFSGHGVYYWAHYDNLKLSLLKLYPCSVTLSKSVHIKCNVQYVMYLMSCNRQCIIISFTLYKLQRINSNCCDN